MQLIITTQVMCLPSKPGGLCVTGGPGFEGPRPMDEEGWMKNACAKFRVFLLDQRGTGLSNPITTSGLLRRGTPSAQAEYLSHFRCSHSHAMRLLPVSCRLPYHHSLQLAAHAALGQECEGTTPFPSATQLPRAQAVTLFGRFRYCGAHTCACHHAGQTTSSGMLRWSGKPCAMTAAALACGRCWDSPLVASVRCAVCSSCHCYLLCQQL